MKQEKTSVVEFLESGENARLFAQEFLSFEATELICTLMERQKTSKSDLAAKIGKSKAFVSQLLGGSRNMTLHTLADVCHALGYRIQLDALPVLKQGVRPGSGDRRGVTYAGSARNWWAPVRTPQVQSIDTIWMPSDPADAFSTVAA